MKYQDGTHDPVSADELARDREQEKLPFWTCQRCNAKLFDEDWAAQNWLVCKLCGEALCEECLADLSCTDRRHDMNALIYWKYLNPESVHDLGFCRPGCLAAAYERDGWEYRKGRLLAHASAANAICEQLIATTSSPGIESWSFVITRLRLLIDQVRAVCNLERK